MTGVMPSASDKRKTLRAGLASGVLQRFPGAMSPLVGQLIEQIGFDGVYISGAVMANDLGLPDIGLTTQTEIAQRGYQIARATFLPAIIDIDTGFGEPMNVARTVSELCQMGLAGCHIEDQIMPKRCGHLDNKDVVPVVDMARKIRAGVGAKCDPDFVLMARSDARAGEGLDKAIDRMKAYVDAGADMIFPEALADEREFAAVRAAISVPLLANMTEFGKTPLLSAQQLTDLGYNMVIYPVTTLRLAMKAIEDGLRVIHDTGTQATIIDKMQTRQRLYQILDYESYNQYDAAIYNFTVQG